MRARNIVLIGVAVTLMVVISKFSIGVPIVGFTSVKVDFGFIIMFLVATLVNPVSGAVVAALADVLHSFLFPVGPFFPGFALTRFLSGLIVGYVFIYLNKILVKNSIKKISFIACLFSVLITQIFSTLLNTVWISIVYSIEASVLIWPRCIALIIRTILITPVCYVLYKFFKNAIFR